MIFDEVMDIDVLSGKRGGPAEGMAGKKLAQDMLGQLQAMFPGQYLRVRYRDNIASGIMLKYVNIPDGTRGVAVDNAEPHILISIFDVESARRPWDELPAKVKAEAVMRSGIKFRARSGPPDKIAKYILDFFRKNRSTLLGESSLDDGGRWSSSLDLISEAMGEASFQTSLFKTKDLGPKDETAGERALKDALKIVAKNPGANRFKRQGDWASVGYVADKEELKKVLAPWTAWAKKHNLRRLNGGYDVVLFGKPGPEGKHYPTVRISAREAGDKGIYFSTYVQD